MLTEQQKENRKGRLGASEVAAILGLSPWATSGDVFLRKSGLLEEQPANESQANGNRFEPVILDWLGEQIGKPIIRGRQYVHANGAMVATLDAQVGDPDPQEIVEAKYSSMPSEWGEDGSDEIPDMYQVQVAAQFACVPSATLCRLPVMLPGFRGVEFRQYLIERDATLIAVVEERAVAFMEMVRKGIRPPEFAPSIEVLKIVRRQTGKTISIPAGLVQSLREAKAAVKAAEEAEETAKAALLAAAEDAEILDFGDAKPATYKQQTRKGLDTDRIKAEIPDWQRFEKVSTFRVLRLPTVKE